MPNPLRDLGLSLEDLQAITRLRGIKNYESVSIDELSSIIFPSKKAKKGKQPKTNFSKARIEEIREAFNESRYKFSKLKINEIRENLLKSKKYYEQDDSEYRGIRNVRYLSDLSIDEDYYELILVKSAFDGNYIQYESRGDKGKNL